VERHILGLRATAAVGREAREVVEVVGEFRRDRSNGFEITFFNLGEKMDINISYVRGTIDYSFECDGSTKCEFCVCERIPLNVYMPHSVADDTACIFHSNGACESIEAQIDVLQDVRDKISGLIKKLEECDEELTRNPRESVTNRHQLSQGFSPKS
jgi:hypothetical protein